LDIETAKTSFKTPGRCEIACVGVLVYKRAGFAWRRGDYRWFGVNQFAELQEFLQGFSGVVLGHNIFDFDYRALQPHIALEGVIEKTVDLRMLLQAIDRKKRARLSLESLARINLKRRKRYNGKNVPALWRAGQVRKVLVHNERDCELTFELWRHLLKKREVRTGVAFGRGEKEFEYPLTQQAVGHLAGHTPQLSHATWLKRIQEWGNAIRPPDHNSKMYVVESDAGTRPLFHRLHCGRCQRAFVLVARRSRLFLENEAMRCPFCKVPVPLESFDTLTLGCSSMATSVYEGQCVFVQYCWHNRRPFKMPKAAFPDARTARAWIDKLRIWDW